jgi:hypothetical protein
MVDKKQLVPHYKWAEDKWGEKDPVSGLWNGVVAEVNILKWLHNVTYTELNIMFNVI